MNNRYEFNGYIDIEKIERKINEPGGRILIGIDGFIDEVWQVIRSRTSKDDYELYDSISQYGNRFAELGKGGMANEIVRKRRAYGGFTANTGNAVMNLGVETVLLALFGKNALDKVFEPFAEKAKIVSIGDPAICHIFEFDDGKAMFPYSSPLYAMDYDFLTGAVPIGKLKALVGESDVIAIGYWTNLLDFDNIISNICGSMLNRSKSQRMFFDFADLRKRDKDALNETLKTLGEANAAIPMTLSLNEHEAQLLFSRHGEQFAMDAVKTAESAARLRKAVGLDEIVVHTPYFAVCASRDEGIATVPQRFCENPVRTTGAGDTFNGGYISAMAKGLNVRERLAVGNATTGFFIGNGYAPNPTEMVDELKRYYENK